MFNKYLKFLFLIALACLILSACNSSAVDHEDLLIEDNNSIYDNAAYSEEVDLIGVDESSEGEIYNDQPQIVGGFGGSDSIEAFFFPFVDNYTGICVSFIDYVGIEGFYEWKDQLEAIYFENDIFERAIRVRLDANIINFIEFFGITREEFRQVALPFIDDPSSPLHGTGYSDEMIDALFSRDMAEMYRLFNNPFTFYHDGEVYTLHWLATHTYEDYLERDLPVDVVLDRVELSLEFGIFSADMERVRDMIEENLEQLSVPYTMELTIYSDGLAWYDIYIDHVSREGFAYIYLFTPISTNVLFKPDVFDEEGRNISSDIARVIYFLDDIEYDTLAVGELGMFAYYDLFSGSCITITIELSNGTVFSYTFQYSIIPWGTMLRHPD